MKKTATEKLAEERAFVALLQNNISKLSHENARMEMQAARLLRRALPHLSPKEALAYADAFKLPADWNK